MQIYTIMPEYRNKIVQNLPHIAIDKYNPRCYYLSILGKEIRSKAMKLIRRIANWFYYYYYFYFTEVIAICDAHKRIFA